MGRRAFFRRGLRHLMGPLVQSAERFTQAVERLESVGSPHSLPPSAEAHTLLRPPGALPEAAYLERCTRCGRCAGACPVQCIHLDPAGRVGEGAPYVDPGEGPCMLCAGLSCMGVCPTGAMAVTPLEQIHMGTAVWSELACLRSAGTACTTCVTHCPRGAAALQLVGDKVHVIAEGCVGCGVCQNRCPAEPKAIQVAPSRREPRMDTGGAKGEATLASDGSVHADDGAVADDEQGVR
jgi:ferredoxin-type protein NapG